MRKLEPEYLRRLMALLQKVEKLESSMPPSEVGYLRAEAFILWARINAILVAEGLEL